MPVAARDGMGILSQCTYRCVVLPDPRLGVVGPLGLWSQCTYRCVVLPDAVCMVMLPTAQTVSMHLQVRGAP